MEWLSTNQSIPFLINKDLMHVLNPLSYLIQSYFVNCLTSFTNRDCISDTDCSVLAQRDGNDVQWAIGSC